jgi:hypothetical protein
MQGNPYPSTFQHLLLSYNSNINHARRLFENLRKLSFGIVEILAKSASMKPYSMTIFLLKIREESLLKLRK